MGWYVTGPVHPVPGSSSSNVLQKVFNGPQGQVTLAVGSPVSSLPPPPAGEAGTLAAAQRLLTVRGRAGRVFLKVNEVIIEENLHYKVRYGDYLVVDNLVTWSQWTSVRNRTLLCGEPGLGGEGGGAGGLGMPGSVTFQGA